MSVSSQAQGLPLSKALEVQAVDSNTYAANISQDFCYGSALAKPTAHGGYVASLVYTAIGKHFRTTLSNYNQPDTLTFHAEYFYASNAGPIRIKLITAKLGKGFSTVQFTASQNGQDKLAGYATNFNASLRRNTGFTYPTLSPLEPFPPPPISFPKLAAGTDPNWICHQNLYHRDHGAKSQTQTKFALPRAGQLKGNYLDEWVTPPQQGARFTTECLGWVVDQWPQGVAAYRPEITNPGSSEPSEEWKRAAYGLMNTPHGIWKARLWYPTMMMDIEVKKALPSEGVEWLFVRAIAKQIKDGRMDLEVIVMDEGMELVALSHHVCLVIEIATKGQGEGKGKL